MKTVTGEQLSHSYNQDPKATPTEIMVGADLVIIKGTVVKSGENEGVVTGFSYNVDGHLGNFYQVEVVWFKGPHASQPQTRYVICDIDDFLRFLYIDLVDS